MCWLGGAVELLEKHIECKTLGNDVRVSSAVEKELVEESG